MEGENKDPNNPPAYSGDQQQDTMAPPAPYPTDAPPSYPTQAQPAGYPSQPGQPQATGYPAQPQPVGYPDHPQPVGYPAQPHQGGPGPQSMGGPPLGTAVTTQPMATTYVTVPIQRFTSLPQIMQCTNCGKQVTTRTSRQVGPAVWMVFGIICLVTVWFCFWPLAFIPFCIPSLKDTIHTCPECRFILGKHSAGGTGL